MKTSLIVLALLGADAYMPPHIQAMCRANPSQPACQWGGFQMENLQGMEAMCRAAPQTYACKWTKWGKMQNLQAGDDTAAAELTKMVVGIEKGLQWIDDLALGDVKKVIEIRAFLKDLTQLMSIVKYSQVEYRQAVTDFARILNQYMQIAEKSRNIAKLTKMSIVDASDYAESIEELDDRQDKIDTWEVVVNNITKNSQAVQAKVSEIADDANTTVNNIVTAKNNMAKMMSKTKQGLEMGEKKVQQAALTAQQALDTCEEEKAKTKAKRFKKKDPLSIAGDVFESITDNSIDPCIAKERNVRYTLDDIKTFEEGRVNFDTVISANLKSSFNDLLATMQEFEKPEFLNDKFAPIKVDRKSEPGLSAVYKEIHTETTNVHVLAGSVEKGAEEKKSIAQAGITQTLANMMGMTLLI